jgi:hypothetical protein
LPNTNEGKQQEHKHTTDALLLNGYPRKFLQEVERKRAIRQEKASSPEEMVKEFFDLVEPQSIVTVTLSFPTLKAAMFC